MAAVAFLFVLTVHFSWELSRLEERTRTLAEEVAFCATTSTAGAQPTQPGERGPPTAPTETWATPAVEQTG